MARTPPQPDVRVLRDARRDFRDVLVRIVAERRQTRRRATRIVVVVIILEDEQVVGGIAAYSSMSCEIQF